MNLYLLRHGIAVDRGSPYYPNDDDRPLTPEGQKKMLQAVRGMKAVGLAFDCILASPVLRAKQTAEIVAGVFDAMNILEFSPHLSTAGDARSLVKQINDQYGDRRDILLAGHEPYMSSLVSRLAGGDQGLSVDFKKGSLCLLQIETLRWGKCATLCWLLTPGQLRAIR
ncbi:MAG TPA: phosphohistidine phosphatase SixA [Candidatus Edwardsbacteria bacterium]|nr:phosphohistidine phosphatase SixA [Candidatus Edwardsbacteria bacterium]